MIEIINLTKSYIVNGKRIPIFKNLNYKLEKGHSLAIMGRNGAGKSTLLRIIGGIDFPDSGIVKTDCTLSWPVGLVGGFQGSLTGRENVIFVSKIFANNSDLNINDRVKRVEEFAELNDYFDKPFKLYSSGMKSRITFGLSMAFDFDVYLIDEISSAGDQRFRDKSRKYLHEKLINSDFIMVDHNLGRLKYHCDRAIILHDGGILEFDDLNYAIKEHKRLLNQPLVNSTGRA